MNRYQELVEERKRLVKRIQQVDDEIARILDEQQEVSSPGIGVRVGGNKTIPQKKKRDPGNNSSIGRMYYFEGGSNSNTSSNNSDNVESDSKSKGECRFCHRLVLAKRLRVHERMCSAANVIPPSPMQTTVDVAPGSAGSSQLDEFEAAMQEEQHLLYSSAPKLLSPVKVYPPHHQQRTAMGGMTKSDVSNRPPILRPILPSNASSPENPLVTNFLQTIE